MTIQKGLNSVIHVVSIWICPCGARLKAFGYNREAAPHPTSTILCKECNRLTKLDCVVDEVYMEVQLDIAKVVTSAN